MNPIRGNSCNSCQKVFACLAWFAVHLFRPPATLTYSQPCSFGLAAFADSKFLSPFPKRLKSPHPMRIRLVAASSRPTKWCVWFIARRGHRAHFVQWGVAATRHGNCTFRLMKIQGRSFDRPELKASDSVTELCQAMRFRRKIRTALTPRGSKSNAPESIVVGSGTAPTSWKEPTTVGPNTLKPGAKDVSGV